jgi:enamine deaminase RidA (YjgF/YER057c/UK114 family)
MTRTPVTSDKFPPLAGPFSPGVQSGSGPLFISGQVGQDPATGALVDGDVTAQAHQALRRP